MTFLEMQQLVTYYLDDLQMTYFTPVQIKQWLNNGQEFVQKLLIQGFEDQFVKSVQTYTVMNQREYQLPEDFRKLNRLICVTSGTTPTTEVYVPMGYMTRNQQDLYNYSSSSGVPKAFFFTGKQLWVFPLPENSNYILRMDYTYIVPTMVNDSDISEIPLEYHELIPICGVVDGLIKDGRDPGTLLVKRNELIDALRKDVEQRHINSPRTIISTGADGDDGGGNWGGWGW